jgi:hypothetical protein
MPQHFDDLDRDRNGCPVEQVRLGDQEVIVHYDDVPATDRTVLHGIPVTTALRTVIDIAPDLDAEHLDRVVRDCLDRRLFSVEEARARIDELDMSARRGAQLLRAAVRCHQGQPRCDEAYGRTTTNNVHLRQ